MQYDFNDYVLTQAAVGLNSRSEVNLEYNPIISAPMDTVISKENAHLFRDQGVNICYPRGLDVEPNEVDFVSVGLNEFNIWLDGEINLNYKKICVDVANGNMPILHTYIKTAKEKWPNIIIMSGNVASPEAFYALAKSGCDYIRVGVGGGSGCLTSVHTGVGQGMATTIILCKRMLDLHENLNCKIVADGGFKNYRDIILALALGADYVMLGGILNKCLESCAEKIIQWGDNKISPLENFEKDVTNYENQINLSYNPIRIAPDFLIQRDLNYYIKNKCIQTSYRGMSTKAVQKDWGREVLKSSEGLEKTNLVEYTISGWMENFKDYLKSAMSYSGTKKLSEFKKFANCELISPAVYNRFNK